MFDVEDRLGRNKYPLSCYLNSKPLTILYGIRKAAQLCDEIRLRITLFNVSAAFRCHLNTTFKLLPALLPPNVRIVTR